MDIGGTATVTRLINRTENIKFEIKFKNRGWFSNSEDFGASAKLLDASGKSMGVAIQGKWNSSFSATFQNGATELLWTKLPKLPGFRMNYFMSKFTL